jgi:hypothetical protein
MCTYLWGLAFVLIVMIPFCQSDFQNISFTKKREQTQKLITYKSLIYPLKNLSHIVFGQVINIFTNKNFNLYFSSFTKRKFELRKNMKPNLMNMIFKSLIAPHFCCTSLS